jgi:protease-4
MEHQQDQLTSQNSANPGNWEREIIEKLAMASITEQTRARRWSVFFKSLMFLYLVAVFIAAMFPSFKQDFSTSGKGHTAVIDLVGMIAENTDASADNIIKSLRSAVKDKDTKGIILHANSPGGSPVQSAYVYDEIRQIKKDHPKLPVYSVVGDICASGCYYIASASDKIFVSPASLLGSIGVIMEGFGFVESMQKIGIERRLLTAGTHKALLDPFSPPKEDEKQFMQSLLDQVHQQFITAVKNGRGSRLKESPEMFSGLIWTGEESIKLGIADDFGNDDYVAKKIIGAEHRVDFTQQGRLIDKLAGKLGASFGQAIGSLLQAITVR